MTKEKLATKPEAIKFASVDDAVDAYAGVLEAYSADPTEENAKAVFEIKKAVDKQFVPDDDTYVSYFDETWENAVLMDEDERITRANEIADQLNAEHEAGAFSDDPASWDHDRYEKHLDS